MRPTQLKFLCYVAQGEIRKYKEQVRMLQNNTKLLQHSLDETTQRLFSYETHAEAALMERESPVRTKSKKRFSGGSISTHALPRRSSSSSTRSNESSRATGGTREASGKAVKNGSEQDLPPFDPPRSVPISQFRVMEDTLSMVRKELRCALLAKEALEKDLTNAEQDLEGMRAERDELVRDRDATSLENAFFGLRASASASRRTSSELPLDATSLSSRPTGQASPIVYDGGVDAQVQVEKSEVPVAGDKAHHDVVDNETYHVLADKFAHVSTVLGTPFLLFARTLSHLMPLFSCIAYRKSLADKRRGMSEKEQMRREALETRLLSLRRSADKERSECADCLQRERERDRERQDSDMCMMDAKAAVLSCRADCGRLRADLAHSLDCLKKTGRCWSATHWSPAAYAHDAQCALNLTCATACSCASHTPCIASVACAQCPH